MTDIRKNESSLNVTLTIDQYDLLTESIAKAHALTHVISLVSDLEQIPNQILHDYLWILADLINDIENSCGRQSTSKLSPKVI